MKIVTFIIVLFILINNVYASEDGKSWLSAPAEINQDSGIPIPLGDSCEVTDSSMQSAISQLAEKSYLSIDVEAVKSFVGECIQVQNTKKPYLVRAVFGHHANGRYSVRRVGDNLLVTHGSLGNYVTYTKSALVVNLSFTPKQVFVIVGIDQ